MMGKTKKQSRVMSRSAADEDGWGVTIRSLDGKFHR
jgi:hypothetical protein